jgi:hypothetical protein
MCYRIQNRLKGPELTPEEQHVMKALRDYQFDPALTTHRDFCPASVLFETYRQFVRQSGLTDVLSDRQFGVALRRAFKIDAGRKTRRTYQGRNVNGYCFVSGPESIVSHDGRGNPELKSRKRARFTCILAA